jgi:hydroxymethylglutaryl-CoA lyase
MINHPITDQVRLTDCPRDAMQGLKDFIPTDQKISYLRQLLNVGFDVIDFGSFVSPAAIPQLKDTAEVLEQTDLGETNTKLLAIVGNMRGAQQAVLFSKVSYLGFPFSVSETFLRLNIHSDLQKAFTLTTDLIELCDKHRKKLIIYLSMGFGNPYGDPWSIDMMIDWVGKLHEKGATEINLSDTIGVSTAYTVQTMFNRLIQGFPEINFGFHLHTAPGQWFDRVDAAWNGGCRSFDGVLAGHGGCPMSGHKLVGNLGMKDLISYFDEKKIPLKIDRPLLDEIYMKAPF